MSNNLQQIEAPALPLGSAQYTKQYQDQLNNVQRLFYNRLMNAFNAVIGSNGGQYIDCPNGLFFNTADQTFSLANTAYPIVYDETYLDNAVALQTGSTSKIEVTVSGVYNFQYSGQLESTNNSSKNFFLWIRRDGTDIGYSTRAYSISGSGTYRPVSFSFNIDLQAGQYIELMASASDTTLNLGASTASSPHPGIPSSVITVNFVAPLPAVTPTPP